MLFLKTLIFHKCPSPGPVPSPTSFLAQCKSYPFFHHFWEITLLQATKSLQVSQSCVSWSTVEACLREEVSLMGSVNLVVPESILSRTAFGVVHALSDSTGVCIWGGTSSHPEPPHLPMSKATHCLDF